MKAFKKCFTVALSLLLIGGIVKGTSLTDVKANAGAKVDFADELLTPTGFQDWKHGAGDYFTWFHLPLNNIDFSHSGTDTFFNDHENDFPVDLMKYIYVDGVSAREISNWNASLPSDKQYESGISPSLKSVYGPVTVGLYPDANMAHGYRITIYVTDAWKAPNTYSITFKPFSGWINNAGDEIYLSKEVSFNGGVLNPDSPNTGTTIRNACNHDYISNGEGMVVCSKCGSTRKPMVESYVSAYFNDTDNMLIDITATENIFYSIGDVGPTPTTGVYLNDHKNLCGDLNTGDYFTDFFLINGKSFTQISNDNASSRTYEAPTTFPLNMGGVYAPVTLQVHANVLSIRIMYTYITALGGLEKLEISFKQGLCTTDPNGVIHTLLNDVDFVFDTATNRFLYDRDINNNIGALKPSGSGDSVKNFDQKTGSLVQTKDPYGKPAYHFSRSSAEGAKCEVRFYTNGNAYYAENKLYHTYQYSFYYKLNDTNHDKEIKGEGGSQWINMQRGSISDTDYTTSYALQIISLNRVCYYCYDAKLINDNAWHRCTLRVSCPDSTGLNIKLFNFKGSFDVSQVKVVCEDMSGETKANLSFTYNTDGAVFTNVKIGFSAFIKKAYWDLYASQISEIGIIVAKKTKLSGEIASDYRKNVSYISKKSAAVSAAVASDATGLKEGNEYMTWSARLDVTSFITTDKSTQFVATGYFKLASDKDSEVYLEEKTISVKEIAQAYINDEAFFNTLSANIKAALQNLAA